MSGDTAPLPSKGDTVPLSLKEVRSALKSFDDEEGGPFLLPQAVESSIIPDPVTVVAAEKFRTVDSRKVCRYYLDTIGRAVHEHILYQTDLEVREDIYSPLFSLEIKDLVLQRYREGKIVLPDGFEATEKISEVIPDFIAKQMDRVELKEEVGAKEISVEDISTAVEENVEELLNQVRKLRDLTIFFQENLADYSFGDIQEVLDTVFETEVVIDLLDNPPRDFENLESVEETDLILSDLFLQVKTRGLQVRDLVEILVLKGKESGILVAEKEEILGVLAEGESLPTDRIFRNAEKVFEGLNPDSVRWLKDSFNDGDALGSLGGDSEKIYTHKTVKAIKEFIDSLWDRADSVTREELLRSYREDLLDRIQDQNLTAKERIEIFAELCFIEDITCIKTLSLDNPMVEDNKLNISENDILIVDECEVSMIEVSGTAWIDRLDSKSRVLVEGNGGLTAGSIVGTTEVKVHGFFESEFVWGFSSVNVKEGGRAKLDAMLGDSVVVAELDSEVDVKEFGSAALLVEFPGSKVDHGESVETIITEHGEKTIDHVLSAEDITELIRGQQEKGIDQDANSITRDMNWGHKLVDVEYRVVDGEIVVDRASVRLAKPN